MDSGFAPEPAIGPATSGRTRWARPGMTFGVLFRFRRQLFRLGDPAFDAAGKPDLLADIVGSRRRQRGDLRVVEDAEVVELLLDHRRDTRQLFQIVGRSEE